MAINSIGKTGVQNLNVSYKQPQQPQENKQYITKSVDALTLSKHYKDKITDIRFTSDSGKLLQLKANEGKNIKHMLEVFVKDPEAVESPVYPKVLLQKPEALYNTFVRLGKSDLFKMSRAEVDNYRQQATTEQQKARFCRQLIKSIKDYDAFSNVIINDMNYELYKRLFPESASTKEMDTFNTELKTELDKERDFRMMAWKDNTQFLYGLNTLAEENEIENLKKPNEFQQTNLDTLTYDKLAEYIFPVLVGHFFSDMEVKIGTDYCDSKGNDIYAWNKKDPLHVTAYDLTTATGDFLKKKMENNRKYAHLNRQAAENFLTIMEEAEGIDQNKIQISKKIATLDGPLWKEFMWGIMQLVLKDEFTLPKSDKMNEEAVNKVYETCMREIHKKSGAHVLPLKTYLSEVLSEALDPKAISVAS